MVDQHQLSCGPGFVSTKKRVDHATCSHAKREKKTKKHAAGLLIAACVFLSLLLVSERQGWGVVTMATALRLPLLLRSRSTTVSSLLSRRRCLAAGRLGDDIIIKLRSSSRSTTTSLSSLSTATNAASFGSPLVTVEQVRWRCIGGSSRAAHCRRGGA